MPAAYDFERSTEENYAASPGDASGIHASQSSAFAAERSTLDYNYHSHYVRDRIALQDKLVRHALAPLTFSRRSHPRAGCVQYSGADGPMPPPEKPWLVLTAGPMGAGKSHVVNWMGERGLFPLKHFVRADPDHFRDFLPEWPVYKALNPETAGVLTKKEAGLLVELTTEAAMSQGLHVWQDGSLQDADFFRARFRDIRRRRPQYRIAILYVAASEAAIRRRVRQRGEASGRVVPVAELNHSLQQVPLAFDVLAPLADLAAVIDNDSESCSPALREVRAGPLFWTGAQAGGLEGLPKAFMAAEATPPDCGGRAAMAMLPRVHAITWNLLAPCYFRLGAEQLRGRESSFTDVFVARMRKQLRELRRFDLAFLQEVWLQSEDALQVFREETDALFHLVFASRGAAYEDGVAIMAKRDKFEVRRSGRIPLPYGRVAAAAELCTVGPSDGAAFLAVSCHLNFPHDVGDENVREAQVAGLCEGIEAFSSDAIATARCPRLPVLLAGDFNTERGVMDSVVGTTLLQRGFQSVHLKVHGREAEVTHCNHRGQFWCSDLVLARPGKELEWRFESVFLLPVSADDTEAFSRPRPGAPLPTGAPYSLEDWADLSDHRPLVAHLGLVPRQSAAQIPSRL